MIYLNKGLSSSQAIYKSILPVIQDVWHDQGSHIHMNAKLYT